MTVIDCYTCPVRGRHCGDCIVPVVARQWLPEPAAAAPVTRTTGGAPEHRSRGVHPPRDPPGDADVELQDAEWDAVEVFVRAGMVNTLDAADARAVLGARSWSHAG